TVAAERNVHVHAKIGHVAGAPRTIVFNGYTYTVAL
ncbi:MAG: hypothetical protein QOE57_2534, partial [Acidimicrobiaceae bacterium]|nr:hypothetical protein [Acidimicrobiaceae bacterium]